MFLMSKRSLSLALILILSFPSPSQATTKVSTVSVAFNKLIKDTKESIDSLERSYEEKLDALDSELNSAKQKAEEKSLQEILVATNLYAPQITKATKAIEDAKAKFSNVAKVKISRGRLINGNERVYRLLKCPPTVLLPNGQGGQEYAVIRCDGGNNPLIGAKSTKSTDPGATIAQTDFGYGDLTEIPRRDLAFNTDIEQGINEGVIELLTPIEFEQVRTTIKIEVNNLESLNLKLGNARKQAQNDKDKAISDATSARENALAALEDDLEVSKSKLEAEQSFAETALLAVNRAKRDAANFEESFVIAYKFEYNRQKIGEIADEAWTGEWTYRTIDSIMKVNKLARTGDAIASKYSKKAAIAFNSAVGKAFTNEPDFRAAVKLLTSTFKKITNAPLNF